MDEENDITKAEPLLFSEVRFTLAQCDDPENVKNILIEGGAKHINYLSESVTHVIADSNCPVAEEAVELFDKPVVNSLWIQLSLKAKRLLPPEAFSPLKGIFRNVVASFSPELSQNDRDILATTLTFYGARVSKSVSSCTHFITPSPTNPNELSEVLQSSTTSQLKIVAPDWVLESVKSNCCCDELLFDPSLLLPPPPPPPPTPPPSLSLPPEPEQSPQKQVPAIQAQTEVDRSDVSRPGATNPVDRREKTMEEQAPPQALFQSNSLSQTSQSNQQMQVLPASQLPRPRLPANIIRSTQPKFRPLLPPNSNMPIVQRQPVQQHQIRAAVSDPQPKKVTLNYNQYAPKLGPYSNNVETHQTIQQQTYLQGHQNVPMQQQQQITPNTGKPTRLAQPNMYHQVRGHYQNNQVLVRGPGPQPMVQQHPPPQQQQMINRFQDPNTVSQRPYQVCLQSQVVNPGYNQQGNVHRQQIFYRQPNSSQIRMRAPMHQGAPVRLVQNEQVVYDNYQATHQPGQEQVTTHQQSYQGHPAQQQNFQQIQHSPHHQPQMQQTPVQQPQMQQPQMQQPQIQQPQMQQPQMQQPQMQQSQPQQSQMQQPLHPTMQSRPQIPTNFSPNGPGVQHVRAARNLFNNNSELRPNITRPPNTSQVIVHHGKVPRMPNNSQSSQPHPSIFDHIQESNLAQIKAKVPIVTEAFDYYGHDPRESVPKNFPFSGCKFKLIDYEDVDRKTVDHWCEAVKSAGGTYVDKIADLTLLICENRMSSTFEEAKKHGVRCVTIYWINDVLAANKLMYPWKALHLPPPFSKENSPLASQLISVTNLRGKDRREVKEMITNIGANYTDHFSSSNTILICGNVGGQKYERAIEWKIPIANCQILSDILLTNNHDLHMLLKRSKYQIFNQGDPLKLTSYSDVKELMNCWRKPITLDQKNDTMKVCAINGAPKSSAIGSNINDDSGIVTGESNNSDPGSNGKPSVIDDSSSKTLHSTALITIDSTESNEVAPRTDTSSVAIESDEQAVTKSTRKSVDPVRILFTLLEPSLVEQLKSYAIKFSLGVTTSPTNCTHLVVDRISRTSKFICAFSHASHIVSYKWLVESNDANNLLDEKQFILQDKVGEENYSVNLVYSLIKRRKRGGPLFNNMVFFATPGVILEVPNIKQMIESAGGVVATRKPPTEMQIDLLRSEGKRLVVVSCRQDSHLFSSLESYSVDIVTVEFVISGILRQDIDFEAHRLNATREPFIRPGSSPLAQISQATPPKKLKLNEPSC